MQMVSNTIGRIVVVLYRRSLTKKKKKKKEDENVLPRRQPRSRFFECRAASIEQRCDDASPNRSITTANSHQVKYVRRSIFSKNSNYISPTTVAVNDTTIAIVGADICTVNLIFVFVWVTLF